MNQTKLTTCPEIALEAAKRTREEEKKTSSRHFKAAHLIPLCQIHAILDAVKSNERVSFVWLPLFMKQRKTEKDTNIKKKMRRCQVLSPRGTARRPVEMCRQAQATQNATKRSSPTENLTLSRKF